MQAKTLIMDQSNNNFTSSSSNSYDDYNINDFNNNETYIDTTNNGLSEDGQSNDGSSDGKQQLFAIFIFLLLAFCFLSRYNNLARNSDDDIEREETESEKEEREKRTEYVQKILKTEKYKQETEPLHKPDDETDENDLASLEGTKSTTDSSDIDDDIEAGIIRHDEASSESSAEDGEISHHNDNEESVDEDYVSIDQCAICLETFENDDEVCSSHNDMKCRHIFHRDCVFGWLVKHDDCPVCRRDFIQVSKSSDEILI